jgi:hypothetical protein
MSESLRDRIAAVLANKFFSGETTWTGLADAVIAELDLENRITSAICSYAAGEQMALTYHDPNGGGTEFDALTRLISEAPKIAWYAMTYRKPDGPA